MKRITKHICIPINLWESPELTWIEKATIVNMDSFSQMGVFTGRIGQLATEMNIPVAELKKIIQSLYNKGALETAVDEDGQISYRPNLYADSYKVKNQNQLTFKAREVTAIDYDEITEKWNEINPTLPSISRWTPQRKKKLRTLLQNTSCDLQDLYKAFAIIASVAFLNGKNDREWRADIDWLLRRPDALTRLLEGGYSKTYNEKTSYSQIMGGQTENNSDDEYYQ